MGKIIPKAYIIWSNFFEEAVILLEPSNIKIKVKGKVPIRLTASRGSLSRREVEMVRRIRDDKWVIIGLEEIKGVKYHQIQYSPEVKELFARGTDDKGFNAYEVVINTLNGDFRIIVLQRDFIKLRNHIRKLLHSNE